MIVPLLLLAGGALAAVTTVAVALSDGESVPDHPPDYTPTAPGSTGYKRIDAILDKLRAVATSSGIPLGLIVAWIAKESGGRLDEVTKLDERGLFQLMSEESKSLGLDHQRLSTDLDYSIASGPLIINKYAKVVDGFGVPRGSTLYWMLVKLCHTMGSGDAGKIIRGAQAAGVLTSWPAVEKYALSGDAKTKHSPDKWMPFMDKLLAVGKPFGFGTDTAISGFDMRAADVDALACVVENHGGNDESEQQAVAWLVRNRARKDGIPLVVACQDFPCSTPPAPWSRAVAEAVYRQPFSADPTGGAVDFWRPGDQRLSAQVYRGAVLRGDMVGAAETGEYKSEVEVREEIGALNLTVVGFVGTLELLGRVG